MSTEYAWEVDEIVLKSKVVSKKSTDNAGKKN